jgi:RND superfamily putative drug exporter
MSAWRRASLNDASLRLAEARASRFGRLGHFASRHFRLIIGLWLIAFVASIPILLRVEEPLKVGGFSSDQTEAAEARRIVERELSGSASQLVVVYTSRGPAITDPAVQAQFVRAVEAFRGHPRVQDIILPTDNPSFISENGTTAYALVSLDLGPEESQRFVPEFEALVAEQPDLDVTLAGGPAFYADIETVSQRDLQRAELIAFPFALAALLLVFGTVVAAFIPLLVGGFGVAAVLTAIYLLANLTDLSIFVLNLATMLGLGLAIDYSLFITSRFREELRRSSVDDAVAVTMATAGRAIFYSGLTVLIGLSGLTLFSFMFLRSVGLAGVVVVFFSVLAALTLLPALLRAAGHRVERLAVVKLPEESHSAHGFWARLSRRVMQRPVLVLIPTALLLVAFGAPFRHVIISSPDATILPKSTESRQGFDELVSAFGPGEISPMVVVFQSPDSVFTRENIASIRQLVTSLQADDRVTRVEGYTAFPPDVSPDQAYSLVQLQRRAAGAGIGERFGQFANKETALVLVYARSYPNSDESKELLADVRDFNPAGDLTMTVDGGTAEIVDVVAEMYGSLSLVVGFVLVATYLVLFLLFQSVFLPLKAIVMNTLSLVASYGAMVWVFQDGHLSWLLRFEPLGYVEASLPIIMFCVLFGLSMDYEVFLLSRVREEWERTRDNIESVAVGLQRSGRIITSAALIVVVVTTSFVSADVIIVKALGFGIALAVFLDATIVRALLVPATMRLMGHWNWWRPQILAKLSLPALRE